MNITVGVCVCYPFSGGDAPVYLCHLGQLNHAKTNLTVQFATNETPPTLPSPLPLNVSAYTYQTFHDSITSAKNTWTVTTASTSTKWVMTLVSENKAETTIQPFKKPVKSVQTTIVPGLMTFQTTGSYYIQFTSFDASVDINGVITVTNCTMVVDADTYFNTLIFTDWNDNGTSGYYYTTVSSGAGGTCVLYPSGNRDTTHFRLNRSPKLFPQLKMIHPNSECSYCGVSPIIGVKYSCNECINYHLCSICEEKNIDHGDHLADHQLLKIKVPLVVHEGVTCNDCGVSPIKGIRYKCQVCDNYDLCEKM